MTTSATKSDTEGPSYEAVQLADWVRDRAARVLADAAVEGTLAVRPELVELYAESVRAVDDVRAAWNAKIDAVRGERGLQVTR